MSLLFIDSFDHYATADLFKKWTSPGLGGGGDIVVGAGRCGSSALHFNALGGVIKGVVVGGTPSKGYCGFAYHALSTLIGSDLFQVLLGSIANWTAKWELSGAISVRNGFGGTMAASSAAGVLNAGAYAYIECGWTIGTVGAITIRVNGAVVLAATGINTTAPVTGPYTTWDAIALLNATNTEVYFDDVYVTDDLDDGLLPAAFGFLGDSRVEYRRPTAEGASTGWTVVGGGTHANAVDKDADSTLTTPSITAATLALRDTNAYEDPSITSGSCFGVQVSVLAVKDAAGPASVAAVVRHGGSDALAAAQNPAQTTARYLISTLGRNPVTGVGWTLAQVAAAEFGVDRVS